MDFATKPASPVLALAEGAQGGALSLDPLLMRYAHGREAITPTPTGRPNLLQCLTEITCVKSALNTRPNKVLWFTARAD